MKDKNNSSRISSAFINIIRIHLYAGQREPFSQAVDDSMNNGFKQFNKTFGSGWTRCILTRTGSDQCHPVKAHSPKQPEIQE